MEKAQVVDLVFRAMQEYNEGLPAEHRATPALETPLFGKGAKLDSLGLVNLIVVIEDVIAADHEPITLVDEKAMSQKNSPFRTVETLVDYITQLMKENVPTT